MSNTKSMEFIETPFKAGKAKDIKAKISDGLLSEVNTSQILWHLVKRHKFGLVLTWAVLVTISWAVPPFWSILGSLVGR